MEYHKIANIFPLLDGDDFKSLCKSIAKNGLRNKITLYEGKILDGRNRYNACIEVGVIPEYWDYDGDDPIEFVADANLERRHLTPGQRAFAGIEMKRLEAERAKKRLVTSTGGFIPRPVENFPQADKGKSRDKAAEIVGVNPKYIDLAETLEENAPDLAEEVKSGNWTMNRAKNEYNRRKKKEHVKEYTQSMLDKPKSDKQYNVIYADPPWQYSSNAIDKHGGVADNHYSTLELSKIKSYLDDNDIKIQDNAVLFLWVTNPFLEKALEIVKAWGFKYKSNIVWVKTERKKPGVGYYVRGWHELLFICTRGSFTPLDKNISPPIGSIIESPIGDHSAKPREVYEIIERLYPNCLYAEIFSRNSRHGWDMFGDDAG